MGTHCPDRCSSARFPSFARPHRCWSFGRRCSGWTWGSAHGCCVLSASCPETETLSIDQRSAHETTHVSSQRDLDSGSGGTLSTGVGFLFTGVSKPQNLKWNKCASSFLRHHSGPFFLHSSGSQMALFSPSWPPVPHYTAEITTVFTAHRGRSRQINSLTHRSQTFEGTQKDHHSSHCDSNKSLQAPDRLTFGADTISRFFQRCCKRFS